MRFVPRNETIERLARTAGSAMPTSLRPPYRRLSRWTARQARWLAGRLEGVAYVMEGRGPDEDVDDAVLAQRVRSALGPVEKRLDVPRARVTVEDGEVTLRGVVGTDHEARSLAAATAAIVGVRAVHDRLHVGMGPGDTRPSEGRAVVRTSEAWQQLVGAARGTGLDDEDADRVTRAVLATFSQCLPAGERDHVMSHLPADVRQRVEAPLEVGSLGRPRTVGGFDRAVAERAQMIRGEAGLATRAVIDALRTLVPEELSDVEAVLPRDLKALWADPTAIAVT